MLAFNSWLLCNNATVARLQSVLQLQLQLPSGDDITRICSDGSCKMQRAPPLYVSAKTLHIFALMPSSL